MLLKFFGSRNHNVPLNPNTDPNVSEKPSIVQIIHAGGIVERYYMAFPASWIIDKYPKFLLTRPDIFHQPWDSVVQPEEILVPGQKYFLVPILTVKKLRRRMLIETSHTKPLPFGKLKPANRRVRFTLVDSNTRHDSQDKGKKKKTSNGSRGLRKKNGLWQPYKKSKKGELFVLGNQTKAHDHFHLSTYNKRWNLEQHPKVCVFLKKMSDDKIMAANLKNDLQELSLEDVDTNTKTVPTSIPSSSTTKKSSATKMNCLCAPTNHPGSFRCRKHRASLGLGNRRTASVGANLHLLGNNNTPTQGSREF